MRIALLAGETSGDSLGAGLIEAIKAREPTTEFFGVTGPKMRSLGCESLADIDSLSLIGLFEILKHLPRLYRLRAELVRAITARQPDLVVGIDAPDFNIGLERQLKQRGLNTLHYVSPTVWAWRPGRAQSLARAASGVLTLFPFEAAWYRNTGCAVHYVGHPLADELYPPPTSAEARITLGLAQERPCLVLLPGSRGSEWRNLGPGFFTAAALMQRQQPELQVVLAAIHEEAAARLEAMRLTAAPELQLTTVVRDTHRAIAAADVALLASGTVALEAMLLGTPMVVAYRMGALSYCLARRLVVLRHFSLPNILLPEPMVPEFVQNAASPERLATAVRELLDDAPRRAHIRAAFVAEATRLRRGANARAAEVVIRTAQGVSA